MTYLINTKDFDEVLWSKVRRCEGIISPGIINRSSKNHSLLGRVLLSYALYQKGLNRKFSFTYGDNGKPRLKSGDVFFNISHSGDYVICSLSESEIGCDVQIMSEYKEKIAKRFFTKAEHDLLNESGNPTEDFTKLWTLKESVLKKTGEGITGGLDSVCFASCLNKNYFVEFGYHFHVSRLIGAYISVCSDSEVNEITVINKKEIENYTDLILKGEL